VEFLKIIEKKFWLEIIKKDDLNNGKKFITLKESYQASTAILDKLKNIN